MRKIRRNKKHSMKLVRRIRNLFDSALYIHKWGFVDILDSQTEEGLVSDYLNFLGKMMPDNVVSVRTHGVPELVYVVIEPLSFAVRPYALRDDNAVLHYAVRIKDDFRIGRRVYSKGDILYVDIDDEGVGSVLTCAGCSRPIVGDEYIETSDTNRIYCTDCEDNYYFKCESCGEYFDENYITARNDRDRHICDGCYEDGADEWFYCDDCEEICVGESWYAHHNGDEVCVCEDCYNDHYYRCDDCDESVHEDNIHHVDDWTNVCDDCLEENWRRCEGCDEYYRCDDMHYDNGDWYCESCWDERDRDYDDDDDDDYNEDEGIRSYHDCRGGGYGTSNVGSYGMEYLLVATREENPMLGVELEIDCGGHNHENARAIRNAIGWDYIICSSDSTLDHGFELVSCPADLQSHMETLDWLSGVTKALELGYKSHDAGTCGLHTHIDRAFFEGEDPQITDSKFVVVLQNNVWWMRKFSRRDDRGGSWGWCEPNPRRYLNDEDKLDRESCKNKYFIEEMKNKGAYSHHLALNFDHGNTLEIRFYRGTLKYNSFLAALQCSDIWARLVKGITVEEASEIGLADFIRVAQHRRYTAFLNYINERGIALNNEPKRKLVRYMNNDDYKYVSC